MLWISSKDLAGFSKMLREYFVDHKIDAVSFFSTAAAQKRHIRRSQIGKQKRKDKVNSNSSRYAVGHYLTNRYDCSSLLPHQT